MPSAPTTVDQPSGKKHPWRAPRQKIETLMYVDLGLENGGFPINVSEEGMAFHGIRPMEKDQRILIKFKLPGLSNSVESAAQIAWLNDLRKGGGLRFIDLPEGTRILIKEWISQRISFRALTDSAPDARTPVEAKIFNSVPTLQPVSNPDHSATKIESKTIEVALDSSVPSIAATNMIKASNTLTLSISSVDSGQAAISKDPFIETESRHAWRTRFSGGIITSLVIAAILGVVSIQFHWSLPLPVMSGNLKSPASISGTPTASQVSSEMQTAGARPEEPVNSESAASLASRAAIDTSDLSEQPAAPEPIPPVSRGANLAKPLKIKPPKVSSHLTGTNAKPVAPSLLEKSLAAEITPPTLTLPPRPEFLPQLPALFLETPSPAPSPRESAQRSTKFEAAQVVARNNPVYPTVASAIQLSGSVELHFLIGPDGHVHNVTVVHGHPVLARAAVDAVQTWRYQPARRDGIPVETESKMVFVFRSK
jgi:TonB family protein